MCGHVSDKPACDVRPAWSISAGPAASGRGGPQRGGVAVQTAVLCGPGQAVQVTGPGCAGGQGVPERSRAQLVAAGPTAVLVQVAGHLVAGAA